MREEQDWLKLEQENRELRELLAQRDAEIAQYREALAQLINQIQPGVQSEELVVQLQQVVAELLGKMQAAETEAKNCEIISPRTATIVTYPPPPIASRKKQKVYASQVARNREGKQGTKAIPCIR